MKKLSDYQGAEAIELWAELLEPCTEILTSAEVKEAFQKKKPIVEVAKTILKTKPKETEKLLLCIDPSPVNGINILMRLVALITDLLSDENASSFFGFAAQAKEVKEYSGSPMENTTEN